MTQGSYLSSSTVSSRLLLRFLIIFRFLIALRLGRLRNFLNCWKKDFPRLSFASALSTFSKWAKLATKRGGAASSPKAVLPQFLERLCICIRAAKARAVLRRGDAAADQAPSAQDLAALALSTDR